MIEQKSFDKFIGATFGRYYLEQFVEERAGSPVFLVQSDKGTTKFFLHLLTDSMHIPEKNRDEYFTSFQTRAAQIAALQHPYLLPLVDYGIFHNIPYLVSPQISMRSLRSRLDKNGPMDIYTAGRYLDQICTVLEYAHQSAIIHESLSIDCIYLRLDGQILVANPGLRSMIEPYREGGSARLASLLGGGYAPEQLLGKPVGPYTDVYSLGAVLYHMLTGSPVFTGNTPKEIAQRHLYASIPPLTQWRRDLPSGIYSIFSRAMGKDPAQRFYQPAGLANAYHRIVDPNNKTRLPFVINATPPLIYQVTARSDFAEIADTAIGEDTPEGEKAVQVEHMPPTLMQTPFPAVSSTFVSKDLLNQRNTRRTALQRRFGQRNRRTIPIIASILIVALIASTIIGVSLFAQRGATSGTTSGQVAFFDGQNVSPWTTDSLTIAVHGLNTPQAGFHYDAWLINNDNEQVIALGTVAGNNQSYHLQYSGTGTSGNSGPNLLAPGDKIEITLEQGTVKQPVGNIVLAGTFPLQSFAHIIHLLVNYPDTPDHIGMLVGVLNEAYLLNIQGDVLAGLAAGKNSALIECAAQNIINIIEGTHGTNYRPLAATCLSQGIQPGDGFGLIGKGFLAGAAEHATLAISQPDATNAMRIHAALMEVALSNIKTWATTIDQEAIQLRNNPANLSQVVQMAQLTDDAYHGVDANGDGQIDSVPGEAGALTAFLQGQLMATLSLTSGTQKS